MENSRFQVNGTILIREQERCKQDSVILEIKQHIMAQME